MQIQGLSLQPPVQFSGFTGAHDTVRAMVRAAQGPRGEKSMLVRSVVERITARLQPKDYLGEMIAVRNWVAENVRYVNDPLHVELVKDPQRLIEEYFAWGKANADCFPEGTLTLRKEGMALVPVESLRVGEQIWGHHEWSTVEGVVYRGVLPVDCLLLNNGSQVLLTPEHHIYALRCKHGYADAEERLCGKCAEPDWTEERVRVGDASAGMRLTLPKRVPFGTDEYDPDRAYVEGLYISDGWASNSRFSISGQDGCPKEEQKREVRAICERLGLATRWERKYITVNDAEWALRMQLMGHRAPNKHALSLDLGEGAAGALLRGIMADSGKNTGSMSRTFTTTSRQLAVQTRVLHRMFGVSCGWRFVEHHGGLGKNPIYRLGTRGSGTLPPWRLRIREIERAVATLRVWDIQTSDHRVYLPEHDVTVSQCDELTALIGTMCLQLGRVAEFVVAGFGQPGHYSHVFTRALEPKSSKWLVLDTVAGTGEREMLRRVTTYKTRSLDEPA